MAKNRASTSDILNRNQIEEQTEESEELYRNMVELSPDSILTADTKGVIIGCNTATVNMLGYSKGEIVNRHFSKLGAVRLRDVPKYMKLLTSALGGKVTEPLELAFKRKDGALRLADVGVSLLKVGGKTIIQATLRDMTERRQMEQEIQTKNELLDAQNEELRSANEELRAASKTLEKSEELYRTMVELSPDSILTADTKGVIIDCNTAAVNTLGYSKGEIVNRHFSKLGAVRLRDVPKYMKLLTSALGGKVTEPLELAFKRKDGALRLADVGVSLLKVGGKTIIQATLRDVTERRQMEQEIQTKNEQLDAQNEELRSANEELQATEEELRASNDELREAQEQLIRSEKLAAIGQLAGGVGHELRNPLGAIKNAVYYVKGKVAKSELAQKEPRVIEFLNIMDDEVNSSNKIIGDLLGFSRTNKPTVSPTRIEQVIENALSQTPVPEHIELTKRLDTNLPEVEIDPGQIQQVLANIITNAVQAMPDEGKLTIDTTKKGNLLEIEIADTGGGIPDEAIGKIFDPLFTTKAKGIGLGLAVCKSIIDRHGGHIEVKSKVGKGTIFNIKLPLKVA